MRSEPADEVDPRLAPLLAAEAEEDVGRLLEELVSGYARPIALEILRYKLAGGTPGAGTRPQDVEDLCGDVCVQLVARLRRLRDEPGADGIGNLRSYVAVIAYNAFHRYLRDRYPQRHRLQNRIRYVLNHRPQFALWRGANQEWLCGFAHWAPDASPMSPPLAPPPDPRSDTDPTAVLTSLFREHGRPIALDDVVNEIAARTGVSDPQETPLDGRLVADAEAPEADAGASGWMSRRYLSRVWAEIRQLPLMQRRALLLNLRDDEGQGCLDMFPLAGVAGLPAIAEVLELGAVELAALWNDLPLADNAIAERFGGTRQRIINLRKSARQRLARRVRLDADAAQR